MTPWPRVMPALITPFTADGKVDRDLHAHNIEVVTGRGATGVLIAGSTGEGPYLEPGERRELIATARDISPSLVVLCGINAESERQASSQIAEAVTSDADGVLVITPTTLVRDRSELVEGFYMSIADSTPIPLFLYSVPGVTGWELPTESIVRLSEHESIVGVKDSGGNAGRVATITEDATAEFIVYVGASRIVLDGHARGAWGAITASANYAYDGVARAVAGDADAQRHLTETAAVVESHGVAGTKFAAQHAGLESGAMRQPLQALTAAQNASIRTALDADDTQPAE